MTNSSGQAGDSDHARAQQHVVRAGAIGAVLEIGFAHIGERQFGGGDDPVASLARKIQAKASGDAAGGDPAAQTTHSCLFVSIRG